MPVSVTPRKPTGFDRFARLLQQLALLWLMSCLGMVLLMQLANAEERPQDARAGLLFFVNEDGQRQRALHLDSRADITIKGMSARVRLWQTFTNTSDQWVEGIYVFPLPDDSAVNFMQLQIGERVITGRIQERAQARATYEAARAMGHRAALTEQERPNLFTQSVANIAPGESVKVELHYSQSVRYDSGSFRLRMPMTLTPRYIPGLHDSEWVAEETHNTATTGWALPTTQVPDAHRITPFYLSGQDHPGSNRMQLSILLEAGMPLAEIVSATHPLAVRRVVGQQSQHDIRPAAGRIAMDRDFELQWHPQVGEAPSAAVFHEVYQGQSFIQLMLLPPQRVDAELQAPRELILVMDTSGSMSGDSIVQARESLLLALDTLAPGDRFNVIEFNFSHRSLFPEPVAADRHNVHMARRFVERLVAQGGTHMIPALRAALRPGAEGYLQQVVFVTDGSVGNEQQVLEVIAADLGDARLFTVGIGSAPNSFLMRKAAELGRGTYTHISTGSQVTERMSELFRKLENPALTGLRIEWPGQTEVYPQVVRDLYVGEPLFVQARLDHRAQRGESIRVSGTSLGRDWERRLVLPGVTGQDTLSQSQSIPPLATQWARQKIDSLLDSAFGQHRREDVREQVLPVALDYQLLSPYTSFVATEETPVRPISDPLRTAPVLNQVPAGQRVAHVAYPQGATGIGFKWLMGTLALLCLIGIFGVRSYRRDS